MVPEDLSATRLTPLVWAVLIALLLLAVGLGMRGTPGLALQYWYLLTVPLMVAAFRFGRRGAMVVSGICVLILIGAFQASDETFDRATAFLGSLIDVASSPQESVRLAFQLADLRAADPTTTFARALLGMALSITSAVIDRKSTRLNSSHSRASRMPSSA